MCVCICEDKYCYIRFSIIYSLNIRDLRGAGANPKDGKGKKHYDNNQEDLMYIIGPKLRSALSGYFIQCIP